MVISPLDSIRAALILLILFLNVEAGSSQDGRPPGQTSEQRLEELKTELKAVRQQLKAEKTLRELEPYFSARIEKFAKARKLNVAQIAQLKVAAKGAMNQHVRALVASNVELPDWAQEFPRELRRSGRLLFFGSFSKPEALQQPVWIEATDKYRSKNEIKRRESHREFWVGHFVDTFILQLDVKLRFSPKQRDGLRNLMYSKFGEEWNRYRFRVGEEYLFRFPLSYQILQVTDDELLKVMNPKKVEKWQAVAESIAALF